MSLAPKSAPGRTMTNVTASTVSIAQTGHKRAGSTWTTQCGIHSPATETKGTRPQPGGRLGQSPEAVL